MYRHKDGVNLRKIEQYDLLDLHKLKSESWWGTHKTLIVNFDDQQKWFDNIPNDQLYMMLDVSEELALQQGHETTIGIGVYTDIDPISRSLKISGSIYENWRKPEYVKAAFSAGFDFAFEMLNMRRVEAEVLSCNLAAQKLEIEHLGFTIEGIKRKAVYKCGHYFDSIQLGMLREEWEADERVKSYGGSCNKNFDLEKAQKASDRCSAKRFYLQAPE